MGPTVAATRPLTCCSASNLANGAAEVAGITEIDGGDRGDGLGDNLVRIDDDAEREAHENGKLGAGVETADIFSGVGLGIAFGLGLGEHGRVFCALIHFAEDEVAGAVENAFHALDAIAGEALLEAGNDGDAAGHRGSVLKVAAFGRGQALKIDAVIGDEFLVGGDDALAGFKCAAHPVPAGSRPPTNSTMTSTSEASTASASSLQTTACGRPRNTLAGDAAVVDVGQFQSLGL